MRCPLVHRTSRHICHNGHIVARRSWRRFFGASVMAARKQHGEDEADELAIALIATDMLVAA